MKILVFTDKGGAGKTTISVDVLPYFFFKEGEEYLVIDTDPNNFTKEAIEEIPGGKIEQINTLGLIKKDIAEQKKAISLISSTPNVIVDTAGGYLANGILEFLANSGLLNEIDLIIIPIKVGGASEPNALKSYLRLKALGYSGRIVFALVGSPHKEKNRLKGDFLAWFGTDFLLEDESKQMEKLIGKEIRIDKFAYESKIAKADRNYFVVPYSLFLSVRWAVGSKPAFAFLDTASEYQKEANEILKKIIALIREASEKGELSEEEKKILQKEYIGLGKEFTKKFFVGSYYLELKNFYDLIGKQFPVLKGETSWVDLKNTSTFDFF